VSGSGISWAICKSAPRSRQITNHAGTPPLRESHVSRTVQSHKVPPVQAVVSQGLSVVAHETPMVQAILSRGLCIVSNKTPPVQAIVSQGMFVVAAFSFCTNFSLTFSAHCTTQLPNVRYKTTHHLMSRNIKIILWLSWR